MLPTLPAARAAMLQAPGAVSLLTHCNVATMQGAIWRDCNNITGLRADTGGAMVTVSQS